MRAGQTGWLGLYREEKAYESVVAHQKPEAPVFETGVEAYFNPMDLLIADRPKDHLLAQGFEDGWEFWTGRKAYFPRPLNPNQDVGNCVGYSGVLSIIDGMCEECYWLSDKKWVPFLPLVWWSYGAGRVYEGNNRLGRGHGSLGAWQIAVDVERGCLPHNLPGLTVKPSERCEPSSAEYEPWSWTRAILDQWAPKAYPYRIGAGRRITSADELLEEVTENYRPCTFASNQWYRKKGYDSRYGITIWEPGGTAAHQTHVRGILKIRGTWFIYIGNQWGLNYHGDPGKGPRGGFWVPFDYMPRIIPRSVLYSRGKFAGRLPEKPDFRVA
jgi:hypothetical protein